MKDNKLIAEFMELKHKNGDFFIPKTSRGYVGGDWLSQEELQYHTSWDWLMPVIENIDHLQYARVKGIEDALSTRHIGDTHKAVVEFIKTYNDEQ